MSMLLLALLSFSTNQPDILDQTDEEWTAPGYRVIEEVDVILCILCLLNQEIPGPPIFHFKTDKRSRFVHLSPLKYQSR